MCRGCNTGQDRGAGATLPGRPANRTAGGRTLIVGSLLSRRPVYVGVGAPLAGARGLFFIGIVASLP